MKTTTLIASCVLLTCVGFLARKLMDDALPPVPTVRKSAFPKAEWNEVPDVLKAAATAIGLERTMVNVDTIAALTAENLALKARVKELESIRPTTKGELAVMLGLKEADLTATLDRSQMITDATMLADVVARWGAQVAWHALQEEDGLYQRVADFKLKNPPPETNSERAVWHSTVFVPFYSDQIDSLCQRLYQLHQLPSTVVEPFRHRLTEGI